MSVPTPILSPSERGPLGQYLWTLRKAAQMTLREVEEASERKVSNAYLSQIETGRIPTPAFFTVVALADAVGVSLGQLAVAADGSDSAATAEVPAVLSA